MTLTLHIEISGSVTAPLICAS